MSSNDISRGSLTPTQAHAITRCMTPNRHSPSAFGEKTYVSKDDYDRERNRWATQLEEFNSKLKESEILNSEMVINRAELNKRIIDLEKNQKPMIDANRKLNDRNKHLQKEIKQLELKLRHTQDDFFTLKDSYERQMKELQSLKEKRVSPEMHEELLRYRNQCLESSKCITALRNTLLDKRKQYEVLVQKFKQFQKLVRKTHMNDDDRMSTMESDCSGASTISLDTITEDFEQVLLLNAADLNEENFLRDSTLDQQQLVIDANQDMMSQMAQLKSTVAHQLDIIKSLDQQVEDLNQQLAMQIDRNDTLEFQFLEMEENYRNQVFEPAQCSSLEAEKENIQAELEKLKKENSELKNRYEDQLDELKANKSTHKEIESYVKTIEELKENERNHQQVVTKYEQQLEMLNNKLKENECTKKQAEEAESSKNRLNEELQTLSKELSKVRFQLNGAESNLKKEKKMTDALNEQLQKLYESNSGESAKKEADISQLKEKVEEQNKKIEALEIEKKQLAQTLADVTKEYEAFKADQRPEIRSELERRFEETRYRLNCALEKIHDYELLIEAAKKTDKDGSLSENLERELLEDDFFNLADLVRSYVKEFNAHLERQFQNQSEIIEALKNKVLKHRSFCDKINKLAEIDDATHIQEELDIFSRENNCDDAKLAANFSYIIKEMRKKLFYSPLQISTAHHQIRPYSSVDSSGEWQSNSSEGITSPDEHDEEWSASKNAAVH